MNKILKGIKDVVVYTIIGLLLLAIILGFIVFLSEAGDRFGISYEAQENILFAIFVIFMVGLVVYNHKKAGKLNLKYFKNLIKDILQIIIAFGGSILFIIILIGAAIAIFNLTSGITKLGTIPIILIIILFVVGSHLERIENELRELRERREDRHDDYDEFK